jgi:tetratricopeptide (TPR) repeat protein
MTKHVGLDQYLLLFRGRMTSGEMLKRIHRHLLAGCESCRAGWDELVEAERADIGELLAGQTEPIPFDPTPPADTPILQPSPYESAFSAAAKRVTEAADRLARDKRHARRELTALLALPAEKRRRSIARAKTSFRSPALANLLVEEARERVRSSWQEAIELLELARRIVVWSTDGPTSTWGRSLMLRVQAHRANAHRVGGDLGEAERRFRSVRHHLAVDPIADPSLDAEVASLEASLRWDQARHQEAATLLDQAVLIYQEVGEREGLARVLIQRASIAQQLERADQALADLERARGLVDPRTPEFLYLLIVVGSAPILLDLERYEEAERVLADAEGAFAATAELWWAFRFRYFQGRVALGRGELERAADLLGDARQGLLEQELPHDAAAASLHLALVHLHQGRTARVRGLCREIAPIFQGCGVEHAALASLALFEQATAADAAAIEQVAQLSRHLRAARAGRRPPQQPS